MSRATSLPLRAAMGCGMMGASRRRGLWVRGARIGFCWTSYSQPGALLWRFQQWRRGEARFFSTTTTTGGKKEEAKGEGGTPTPKQSLLPLLDASPFLDSGSYVRRLLGSVTTISGTEAARRLTLGRRQAAAAVQKELVVSMPSSVVATADANVGGTTTTTTTTTTKMELDHPFVILPKGTARPSFSKQRRRRQQRRRPFWLTGHGVPMQLLHDHVMLALEMLDNVPSPDVVSMLSFRNVRGEIQTVDCMGLRTRDGKNSAIPWPRSTDIPSEDKEEPPEHEEGGGGGLDWQQHLDRWSRYEARLELYLNVMKRLAESLGSLILTAPPPTEDSSILPTACPKICLQHWNVEFRRGFSYPLFLLHPSSPVAEYQDSGYRCTSPICELSRIVVADPAARCTTRTAAGRVRIALQGIPSPSSSSSTENTSLAWGQKNVKNLPIAAVFHATLGLEG